jgi:uncharacterized phage protein (TIGR01671 family)
MRDIKFRVWHLGHKNWINNDAGTHCWSNWMLDIFTGEIVDFVCCGTKSYSREPEQDRYLSDDGFVKGSPHVVQQYTGLKDKNGVDIYEGDILKCKGFDGWFDTVGYYYNMTVKYNTVESGDSHIAGFAYIPMDRKVIGNIFENPEYV